jgi:predicted SnoaL-like aldol condensation-catalyzing enzyme
MVARKWMVLLAAAGVMVTAILAMNSAAKTPEEEKLEENKKTVTAFYRLAFNDHKPVEAIEKFVGGSYRQHNPTVADGSLAFIDFMSDFARKNPGLRVDIKRVIAEGDMVVTHVNIKTSKEDRGLAAIDIFRLENGKIVEHWDVVQPVPEKPANTNTMF